MTPDEIRQPLSAGTETRAAFEAGAAAATPETYTVTTEMADDADVLVTTVPWGGEQVVTSLERYEATPRRRRGLVEAQTVQSLVDYTLRHASREGTTTWVDMQRFIVTSLLNDHDGNGNAGWADHRVALHLRKTPEWQHWEQHDGQLLTQELFAEHIEDGIREIVQPDAAAMLEIASSFQASTNAQFRQATRLQSGQVQLRYDEETTAKAGTAGDLEVPQAFIIGVAPFLGEDPYQITARLRYRIRGGTLSIGYKLDRPELVLRNAMQDIADRISETLPAVFVGTPRSEGDSID